VVDVLRGSNADAFIEACRTLCVASQQARTLEQVAAAGGADAAERAAAERELRPDERVALDSLTQIVKTA